MKFTPMKAIVVNLQEFEESYPISPIAQIINRWTSADRETTFPFDGLVLFVQQSTRFSLLPNPP